MKFWETQPADKTALFGTGIRFSYDRRLGSVSFFREGRGELWIYYPSLGVIWSTIRGWLRWRI